MLDGCTLGEVGDVTFCPFEAVVDVTLGPVDDCVVEDAVGRGFGIEVDWLFESVEDVPFDTGPDGVVGCPSESPDVVGELLARRGAAAAQVKLLPDRIQPVEVAAI